MSRLGINGNCPSTRRLYNVRREHLAEADQPLVGMVRGPNFTEFDVRYLADQETSSNGHGLQLVYQRKSSSATDSRRSAAGRPTNRQKFYLAS